MLVFREDNGLTLGPTEIGEPGYFKAQDASLRNVMIISTDPDVSRQKFSVNERWFTVFVTIGPSRKRVVIILII